MVEDVNRGLFSYEALRSRLEQSRFAQDGLKDFSGPLIRLAPLTPTEIFVLLQTSELHAVHYGYEPTLTEEQVEAFLQQVYDALGAEQLLTPRV